MMGVVAMTCAALWLPMPQLDVRFFVLAIVTMLVSSRFAVKIPRVNTNVTISDTFIFLVLLVYGGFPGILIAAAEGLVSGWRISKKPLVVAFNASMMSCATFLTVVSVRLCFGPVEGLRFQDTSTFIAAVGMMALVQ